jgi:hypothetical protein
MQRLPAQTPFRKCGWGVWRIRIAYGLETVGTDTATSSATF